MTALKPNPDYIIGIGATGEVYFGEQRLEPKRSLKVANLSPTGFAWGYGGFGPAQLALALMLEVCCTEEKALELYQHFKWAVVCQWSATQDFAYRIDSLRAWVKAQRLRRAPA